MSTFKVKDSDYFTAEIDGRKWRLLSREAFERFNPSILGLGELTSAAAATDAIAAVFDLQGFTNFCKQIEPHLTVPVFLSQFLDWMMTQIKSEMMHKEHEEGVSLWGPLPFFVKFMGDGLLVLWNVSRPRRERPAQHYRHRPRNLPALFERVLSAARSAGQRSAAHIALRTGAGDRLFGR